MGTVEKRIYYSRHILEATTFSHKPCRIRSHVSAIFAADLSRLARKAHVGSLKLRRGRNQVLTVAGMAVTQGSRSMFFHSSRLSWSVLFAWHWKDVFTSLTPVHASSCTF